MIRRAGDDDTGSLRNAASASGLASPVYGLVEQGINDALRYDPATRQRIAAHAGRVLAVASERPAITIYLLFTAEGTVELYDSCETSIDATVRAGAFGLLRELATGRTGGVAITGDREFAEEIARIARDIDIDWEEPLARLMGDVVARQVGDLLRGAAGFLRRATGTLRRNGEDFIRHEAQAFPSAREVREFARDTEDLREDADRAEARLEALRTRIDRLSRRPEGNGN